MESGVHFSLHENYNYQKTYTKFNLKIYYPLAYESEVWHYQKANIENIRKAISEFPWERCFANSDVNEKVHLLNKTVKNIVSNYILHKTIIYDDRDPSWINKNIKKLINDKNYAYKPLIVKMKITLLLFKILNSFNLDYKLSNRKI